MAQLCPWTKIRTKQWLVLGTSAFQCMRAGFLCPKWENFACFHTCQDQNELHLERWFFLAKSASSVIRSQANFSALFKSIHTHKNRTQNIECSFGCVAHVGNVANILLFNFCEQKFVQNGPITIAIDYNSLSLLIFEDIMAQLCLWTKIRTKQCLVLSASPFQFCLFIYPPGSKWASSEKMIFFFQNRHLL